MRHRLAANQAAFVEEPFVLAVELLEGIIRQHRGVGLVGNAQNECVTATDSAGWRCNKLVVRDALFKLLRLFLVDPVSESRVDHNRDLGVGVVFHEAHDGFVQLLEARQRPAFGR